MDTQTYRLQHMMHWLLSPQPTTVQSGGCGSHGSSLETLTPVRFAQHASP
jgi:hypothetical protein